tara:strand:- start:2017 stop:2220 length:204 start_codon:yes stop_codon:yes gene_type:complete
MKGMLLQIIVDDDLFMIEFFRCFRIGVAWINDLTGKASSLIIGIWKLETNITIALRKKLDWQDIGEA